jgi:hypothetical protein
MERFNDLYLNKLETRLLNSATSLAHIDRYYWVILIQLN